MTTPPRRMLVVGSEGNRYDEHAECPGCANAGCVPVETPALVPAPSVPFLRISITAAEGCVPADLPAPAETASLPLLPCPSCGSAPSLRLFRGIRCSNEACWWEVQNYGCADEATLAAQWNRRTPSPVPSPERLRLLAARAYAAMATATGRLPYGFEALPTATQAGWLAVADTLVPAPRLWEAAQAVVVAYACGWAGDHEALRPAMQALAAVLREGEAP